MAWQLMESIITGVSDLFGVLNIDNYTNLESSSQDGEPVELYLFNKSNTEYWSYTSTDQIVSYLGRDYSPIAIKRGNISLNTNTLKTKLDITVPLTNPFGRLWIAQPIEGIISITIYRYHKNSYEIYWTGFVRVIKIKPDTIQIICSLKTTSLKRFGLMRKYQRNCGLPLYSTRCTISEDDANFYVDGTVNSVNGTTVDATILSTKTDGWFLGGKFKTNDDEVLQKIVYHSGTEIKIARSVASLKAGDTFRAWAGCDHLKATCKDKFSNKLNYGGFPYLPNKNPFLGDAVM